LRCKPLSLELVNFGLQTTRNKTGVSTITLGIATYCSWCIYDKNLVAYFFKHSWA